MSNSFIENQCVSEVSSWFVSVAQRTIEIKIAKENPVHLICHLAAFKPTDKV
jgi:hypothetical protein